MNPDHRSAIGADAGVDYTTREGQRPSVPLSEVLEAINNHFISSNGRDKAVESRKKLTEADSTAAMPNNMAPLLDDARA